MTPPNKHDLYELCVQSTDHLVPLLRAIHAGDPRVLGEDFAGTAALSHAWAAQATGRAGVPPVVFQAVAVDLDAEALAHHAPHPSVRTINADVRTVADPCDVVFVGNFSIGYLHTRAELIDYLKHAHTRLTAPPSEPRASARAVFLCDTYGGDGTFTLGGVHRPTPMPDGRLCRYTWEQRDADPLTGMVTNAIHFRIERAGVIEHELDDAFVYRWRLWSVPELRDAMHEAGFGETQVYAKLPDAIDQDGNAYIEPVTDPENELGDSYIVLVAGRV